MRRCERRRDMGQQYHVGGIEVEEIEPGIVLVDYGTAIATAERVQDAVDKTREIWGDTRIVVLIEAASATDLARVASVYRQRKSVGLAQSAACGGSGCELRKGGKLLRGVRKNGEMRQKAVTPFALPPSVR